MRRANEPDNPVRRREVLLADSSSGAGERAAASAPPLEDAPSTDVAEARPRRESMQLMLGLSAGHSIQHFYQIGLYLLLPHIKEAMALSDPAMGAIVSVRSAASGVMNIPAGIMADMFRRRVAVLLAASMLCLTLGYLFIGLAPNYWLVLLAITVAGAGTSMWHAPSFSTLSARYPDRRGLALAMHRSGGSIGDTIAPAVVGILLGGVSFWGLNWGGFGWRTVAYLHVGPSLLTGLGVLTLFKSGAVGAPVRVSLREYVSSAIPLFKNLSVTGMVLLSATRGMAHQSFNIYLVLYLEDELGYSDFVAGLHVSLLTMLGVLSCPFMGAISDRVGRRRVIVVAMVMVSALIFCFVFAKSGIPLVILLGLLGAVIFSVSSVISAAALDAVPRGVEGSAVALLFSGGAVIGGIAPYLAGFINESAGFQGVVWFAGSIAAVGAVLALILPIGKRVVSGKAASSGDG